MKKIIYGFIFTKIFGWKVVGTIDSSIQKCVIIAVPHTSWWDFFLGIFSRAILDKEINYVAKKELFVFPFGYFFRWTGGTPLNRGVKENKVDFITQIFKRENVFRLAISPEGTRKKVTQWKTGFYFIAVKAGVPIIPVAFDYQKKEVVFHSPFQPTGSIEDDLPVLHSYFKGIKGKKEDYSFD